MRPLARAGLPCIRRQADRGFRGPRRPDGSEWWWYHDAAHGPRPQVDGGFLYAREWVCAGGQEEAMDDDDDGDVNPWECA